MPTERMEEVEVVCAVCGGAGRMGGIFEMESDLVMREKPCVKCHGHGYHRRAVKPGSLTAARLRLADAAEAWLAARLEDPSVPIERAVTDATAARIAMSVAGLALAALRTARGEG